MKYVYIFYVLYQLAPTNFEHVIFAGYQPTKIFEKPLFHKEWFLTLYFSRPHFKTNVNPIAMRFSEFFKNYYFC